MSRGKTVHRYATAPFGLPTGLGRTCSGASNGPAFWHSRINHAAAILESTFDWPGAAYAIFDSESGNIEFRRAVYDFASLARRLSNADWDSATVEILTRMRK